MSYIKRGCWRFCWWWSSNWWKDLRDGSDL